MKRLLAIGIFVLASMDAFASLIGDQVRLTVTNATGTIFDETAIVVDNGAAEFSTPEVFVDISESAIEVFYLIPCPNAGPGQFCTKLISTENVYLFSSLDWLPNPGTIVGVTPTDVGIELLGPSFTDDSITFRIESQFLCPGQNICRPLGLLDIEAIHGVSIDIKPGSDPNCFNINGHGVIPVAILGSDIFDISNVDQNTLSFGGLSVRIRGNKGPMCGLEDTNSDGHFDLVCHFVDDPTYWTPGSDDATLIGELLDGTSFEATDSICVVP